MFRASMNYNQLDEVARIVSSTAGPLVIGSLIEHGLALHRFAKKPKRSKTKKGPKK